MWYCCCWFIVVIILVIITTTNQHPWLKALKGLKALQQRADSINNMTAENDEKMTNSDEYDAQNEQNFTHFDANCTQKEVTLNFHMV